MKKILYLFPVLMLIAGASSCGDNTDFSTPHVLTDDELAEQARQDSIKQAMLEYIDADEIFYYEVSDYLSTQWTSKAIEIDLAGIGEVFGLTADEVADGIIGVSGAPSITGFCIQASTHADYKINQSTTNGYWGHWFDVNGDAGTWSDLTAAGTIAFYCEWEGDFNEDGTRDPEWDYFLVGQYPDKFTSAQEWTVYECLQYQDKRVAIAINYKLVERGEVVAGVVATDNLSIELTVNESSYDPTPLKFDYDKVLSTLGLSSIDPMENLIAYKEDGSFQQELNADYGFWYDKNGYVGSWGNDASVWISYGALEDEGDDVIGVCLMPGTNEAGDVFVHDFGFMNGSKIYMLNVTVTVIAAAEIGNNVVYTESMEDSQGVTGGYEAVEMYFDQSAVMAALGIASISEAEVVGYKDGEYVRSYTANNGYWYNTDGTIGSYGEATFYIEYPGEDYFNMGQMPYTLEAGNVVTGQIGLAANGKIAWFTCTLNITEGVDYSNAAIVYTTSIEVEIPASLGWEGAYPEFDIDAILSALGAAASTDLTVVGRASDGSITDRCTANSKCGFWYDADGQITSYGADGCTAYVEYYGWDADNNAEYPEDVYTLYVGAYPGAMTVGETYTLPIGFYANDKVAMINVSIKAIQGETIDYASATLASTIELSASLPASSEWVGSEIEFDIDNVLSALGVSSTVDLGLVSQLPGGDFTDISTAGNGFWYNANGEVVSYDADGCTMYIEYWGNDAENLVDYPEDVNLLYVGLYPDAATAGSTIVAPFYFYANDKLVKLNFTLNVESSRSRTSPMRPARKAIALPAQYRHPLPRY